MISLPPPLLSDSESRVSVESEASVADEMAAWRGTGVDSVLKTTRGREEMVEEEDEDDAWLEDSSDLISELTEGISGRDVGA